jgi:predicted Zn-dependent peptidase
MFYVPDNAVLVVTGDIDKAETRRLVEKYFGDIPGGNGNFRRPAMDAEPPKTAEVRDTIFDDIQIPAVVMAYRIPAQGTSDYYAVEMLGTLMSQGQSSRLNRRLVDREEKALQVASFPLGLEHPGLHITLALANMGVDPADMEAIINEEFDRVRNELISEEEMQKLRNQTENSFVNSNTNIARRATNLANYHTLFGNADLINTEIEKYMQVTREDIMRVANEYFRENNRVVLYWLPKAAS